MNESPNFSSDEGIIMCKLEVTGFGYIRIFSVLVFCSFSIFDFLKADFALHLFTLAIQPRFVVHQLDRKTTVNAPLGWVEVIFLFL